MSSQLPWWGYIILAPAMVAWKIKNAFKGKEKELPKKEEKKVSVEAEDPRNRF